MVGQTVVPTLVYGHAKHLVSLTAVPAPGHAGAAPVAGKVGGYNTLTWTEDGVTYWAISDVAAADLRLDVVALTFEEGLDRRIKVGLGARRPGTWHPRDST